MNVSASETTTNEEDHKMEDNKIAQAEEHLKEAETDLKIARDATEAAEHKIDEALQEKWEAEGVEAVAKHSTCSVSLPT
jgi:septum formation inhibitor MinC